MDGWAIHVQPEHDSLGRLLGERAPVSRFNPGGQLSPEAAKAENGTAA